MKIKIQQISAWNMIVTILVTVIFIALYERGENEFATYQTATEQYLICKDAAMQLEDGSDFLTEQVRLYVLTKEEKYLDAYFEEVYTIRSREQALEALQQYFDGTESFQMLQNALSNSYDLMTTEYHAMRLVLETGEGEPDSWPKEIREIELSDEEYRLTESEMLLKAQRLVSDAAYQAEKREIAEDVSVCAADLLAQMRERQENSQILFSGSYQNLQYGVLPLVVLMVGLCMIISRQVIKPLCKYNECIRQGECLPVEGAAELRNLAETYNHIYRENEMTQEKLRYQAQHDALTGLWNRGKFDKILDRYNNGKIAFALIVIDVDYFKKINDTYGHAIGDEVLKKVARLLKNGFRNIDYICRVGGDEFAVIMVDVTSEHKAAIQERISQVNEQLRHKEAGMPPVSLSVGVAFSDRKNPEEDIFKDADKALYEMKENGKNGCAFF